jgi:hypothetical protein
VLAEQPRTARELLDAVSGLEAEVELVPLRPMFLFARAQHLEARSVRVRLLEKEKEPIRRGHDVRHTRPLVAIFLFSRGSRGTRVTKQAGVSSSDAAPDHQTRRELRRPGPRRGDPTRSAAIRLADTTDGDTTDVEATTRRGSAARSSAPCRTWSAREPRDGLKEHVEVPRATVAVVELA